MTRTVLAFLITLSLILQSLAHPAPARAAQFLLWENGDSFITFGPNRSITIDTGAIRFIGGCPEGVDDGIAPFADVYIVPARSAHRGAALRDISGAPNTVMGSSQGGVIVSETIGFTGPSGNIGDGLYDVVYDECQDGIVDTFDFVLKRAFAVTTPTDVPDLPTTSFTRIKGDALELSIKYYDDYINRFILFEAYGVYGQLELGTFLKFSAVELFLWLLSETVSKYLDVDPVNIALTNSLNVSKHYNGIWEDPPNPDFQRLTPFAAREQIVPVSGDPFVVSAADLGVVISNEAAIAEALLVSLERYQGAAAANDGEWALVHARAIERYASQLATQLEQTDVSLADHAAALSANTLQLDEMAAKLNADHARITAQGFSAEERRAGRNLGLTNAEIDQLQADFQARELTAVTKAGALGTLTDLRAGNAALRSDLPAFVSDLNAIVATLETDSSVGDETPFADAGGPYIAVEGAAVTFDGSASTSLRTLDYEWDLDGDGAFDDATGEVVTFTYQQAFKGWVGLQVTDEYDYANIDYASIVVADVNRPPQIEAISPDEGPILIPAGEAQAFSVNASDPDGDVLTAEWFVDGIEAGSGLQLTYVSSADGVGDHVIEVLVTDNRPAGGSTHEIWGAAVVAPDGDEDGWRHNADCDDDDPAVNPGQPEIVGNGKDDDCDADTGDNGSSPTAFFNPSTQGGNVALREGGASIIAFSSRFDSGADPQEMIDFPTNDGGWVTGSGQTVGQFAVIQLAGGKTYQIDRIKIKPRAASTTTRVSDFAVDVSTTTTDDAAFTTILTATAANNSTLQEFVLPKPVLAKYIRYRPLGNRGSTCCLGTDQIKVISGQEGAATVTFTDLSTDPDNDVISWQWTFGDGTSSTEHNPTHRYAGPGTFLATLTVRDARGHSDTASLTQRVYAPPNASFAFTPAVPNEAAPVSFTATAADTDGGTIVQRTWLWDDGDSQLITATSNARSHTFADNGDYLVSWEVIDSQELVTTIQKTVPVQNLPPSVNVGRDRHWSDEEVLDFPVTIKDSGGDSFACSWDFGDGSPLSSDCHFRHLYDLPPGAPPTSFTATLTVTDKDTGVGLDSLLVTIAEPDLLFLSTTLRAGADSPEIDFAEELGFAIDIADPVEWVAMSTSDFAKYKAIVLADRDSHNTAAIAAAESTKHIWGPAITGNVIIIGTDLTSHKDQGGDGLVRAALAFAAEEPGKTGAFISLSDYYEGTNEETPVPILDAFSPGGFTARGVGCYNDAHIVASHPAMAELTDAQLSNWNCSVHEALDRWPDDFLVLAIARGIGAYYTAADGSSGTPYIVARGDDLVAIRDIILAPATVNSEVGASQTLTATVDEGGNPSPNETVTFTVIAGPHQGTTGTTVTDSQGQAAFAYTGTAVGTDTVVATFVDAQNETQTSNEATVRWTSSSNLPPLASDRSLEILRDTPATITLGGSDGNSDTLSFRIVQAPANGTLSGAAPALTYSPDSGFIGTDSFTYVVNDGQADSAAATVTITVRAANQPPVAVDQTVGTDEDTPVAIILAATDPDAGSAPALTYAVVAPPTHGTLSGSAPNLTYTPQRDYHGGDAFTFTANDGLADSTVATVTITVAPINDPPSADPGHHYHGTAGEPITLDGSGSFDPEGDALTFAWDPDYDGVAFDPDPALTGPTPSHPYGTGGNRIIALRVTDAGGATSDIAVAEVEVTELGLTVTVENDGPIDEGQTATITVIVDTASQSQLSYLFDCDDDGVFEVGPQPDTTAGCAFVDDGTFPVAARVGDGQREVSATTNVVVRNVAPAVDLGENATIDENETYAGEGRFADPGADSWTATVDFGEGTGPESLPLRDFTTITLTHAYTTAGAYGVRVCVADDDGDEGCDVLTVTVNRVNRAPTAADEDIAVDEDASVDVVLAATDPDGDSLAFRIVAGPSEGTLAGNAPNLTYTPRPGFSGADAFTFAATDGTVDSNTATVRITVAPVNDPPTAADQDVRTDEDVPAAITLTGADPEGAVLGFAVVEEPAHGSLSGAAPGLTYTPDADFAGDDAFSFRASDGQANSPRATVRIVVAPVNDPPTADAGGPYDGIEGAPLQFDGRRSADPEDDALAFAWDPDFDGTAFAPAAGLDGARPAVTYHDDRRTLVALRVRDAGGAESEVATAEVRIANAPPAVAAGDDGASVAGESFVRDGMFADPGADEWTATVDYGDGAGPEPLALKAAKTFHLEHRYANSGEHLVRVCVRDDDGDEGCATFTVAVEDEPDGPVHEAPPRATIVQPTSGTTVRPGQITTIAIRAKDLEAGVASVEVRGCPGAACVWDEGTSLGVDETAPYELTWTPGASGAYTLIARATDHAGKRGDSPPVTIAVAAAEEPPAPTPGSRKVILAMPDGADDLEAVVLAARVAGDSKKTRYRVVFEMRSAGHGAWEELVTDGKPPYRQIVDLSDLAPGYYEVRAVAVAKGKQTASTAVVVTVPAPEAARRAPSAAEEDAPAPSAPANAPTRSAEDSETRADAASTAADAAGALAEAAPLVAGPRQPRGNDARESERRERGRDRDAPGTEHRHGGHAQPGPGAR